MQQEIDQDIQDHTPEIAEVAYRYWESRGRENGHDVEDWLMAEQEVLRRHNNRVKAQSAGDGYVERHANAA